LAAVFSRRFRIIRRISSIRRRCVECAKSQRPAYGGLYERVDKLLRELENPNLHDIANMSFRIELWDRHALHIRWAIAASGSMSWRMPHSMRP
jgi:hypothetical protein